MNLTGVRILPDLYNANYCAGNCRYPLINATYHAQIQAVLHENNENLVSAPCCVPIKYDPICILVTSNQGIEIQNHHEATVTQCACR